MVAYSTAVVSVTFLCPCVLLFNSLDFMLCYKIITASTILFSNCRHVEACGLESLQKVRTIVLYSETNNIFQENLTLLILFMLKK